MALMKTLHQQESKERNCKSYAWGLRMHDGTTLQWSFSLAVHEIDLHEPLLHYFLNDSAAEGRKKLFCAFQSLWALDRQPVQAAASAVLTLSTIMLKIFGLCDKADMKTNQISVAGWCTGSNAGGDRNSVTTDYTGPKPRKLFVILKCIFMNNSYFHFTLLWFSIWLKSTKTANKSNQTVSQIYCSRKLSHWNHFQNCVSLSKNGRFAVFLL